MEERMTQETTVALLHCTECHIQTEKHMEELFYSASVSFNAVPLVGVLLYNTSWMGGQLVACQRYPSHGILGLFTVFNIVFV